MQRSGWGRRVFRTPTLSAAVLEAAEALLALVDGDVALARVAVAIAATPARWAGKPEEPA